MKTAYLVLDPIGWEEVEVGDTYVPSVPYTAVPPLKNLQFPQSQHFDWQKQIWVEVMLPDVKERVENLELANKNLQSTVATLTVENETTRQSLYELMKYVTYLEASMGTQPEPEPEPEPDPDPVPGTDPDEEGNGTPSTQPETPSEGEETGTDEPPVDETEETETKSTK